MFKITLSQILKEIIYIKKKEVKLVRLKIGFWNLKIKKKIEWVWFENLKTINKN